MYDLRAGDEAGFMRRFRFRGGRLRRVTLAAGRDGVSALVLASVQEVTGHGLSAEYRRARLRIRVGGVEEYRFQKRPGVTPSRLNFVRLAWFEGAWFFDLDGYDLGADRPMPHDFRASNAFLVGRSFGWEEVVKEP